MLIKSGKLKIVCLFFLNSIYSLICTLCKQYPNSCAACCISDIVLLSTMGCSGRQGAAEDLCQAWRSSHVSLAFCRSSLQFFPVTKELN